MSSGIGVSPDSVIYLSAADRLLSGDGLKPIAYHYAPKMPSGQTLINFPPAYPLVLAATNILTQDRLIGARWINSLLLAASVLLMGTIVSLSAGGSVAAGLSAVFLFLSSFPVLEAYTMMWAEPLFIFLLLSALLLLLMHIKE